MTEIPAICTVRCMLHKRAPIARDRRGGRLGWPAGCPACASSRPWRRCRSRCGCFVPVLSDGAPLSSRIEEKKREIDRKKGRERVLTTTISGYTRRINAPGRHHRTSRRARCGSRPTSRASAPSSRASRTSCAGADPAGAPARALAESRAALSERLVELYKADEPDVVTVILESDGFADLLERAEFMQRVSQQDARIIDRVRTAKQEAVATEQRLDRLEERQREVTAERRPAPPGGRRDQGPAGRPPRAVSRAPARRQGAARSSPRAPSATSSRATSRRSRRSRRRSRAAAVRAAPPAGPDPAGLGQRHLAGQRPGRVAVRHALGPPARGRRHRGAGRHADPRRRLGRVVLLGWTGGYGNYTCISHGGSLSTCYAHQSRYATSNGRGVSKAR